MSHKLLMFLKRRPDLSVEAFRAYYETAHAKLCETYAAGARRYVRRYVEPLKVPGVVVAGELPFDVITEVWIDDPNAFAQIRAATEACGGGGGVRVGSGRRARAATFIDPAGPASVAAAR